MASKKKTQKGSEAIQAKRQLAALLLADSFDVFLRPASLETPRVLFPLVNVPLIEYTLEFLASHGVDIIYVFCCSHADKIQTYLNNSPWMQSPEVKIQVIMSKRKDMNAGDALREMYNKGILRDDFVLVFGDVVSNINLQPVLQEHLERRKKDKEAIMTAVFKEARPGHRTRTYHDDVIVALDPQTKQLMYYETSPLIRSVEMDSAQLGPWGHNRVQFRYDLIDCGIAICSTDVLFQFQENFDYRSLPQFLRGVVHEEILGAKAHAHIIQGEYAARVNCFRTYRAISYDIINRWTYPMVPDNNFLPNSTFKIYRNSVYKERNVSLSLSCVIGSETVIGSGTSIGNGSNVTNSVIGRNCNIGNNVVIKGSFIWDNVVIRDNTVIDNALVADGALIGEGSHISRGSIVSFSVKIGKSITVQPFSKLTTVTHEKTQPIQLGKESNGLLWVDESHNLLKKDHKEIIASLTNTQTTTTKNNKMSKKDAYAKKVNTLVIGATELVPPLFEPELLIACQEDEPESDPEEDEEDASQLSNREKLQREVAETLSRADTDVESAKIELNSLKLVYDATFCEMSQATLRGMLLLVPKGDPGPLKKACKKWSPILDKFLDGGTRSEDEVEILFQLQEFCEEHKGYSHAFVSTLRILHELGIVKTESILQWAEEQEEDDTEDKSLYDQTKSFLDELRGDQDDDDFNDLGDVYSDDENPFAPPKKKKETKFKKEVDNDDNDNDNDNDNKNGNGDEDDEDFEWDDDEKLLSGEKTNKDNTSTKDKSGSGDDDGDDENFEWDNDDL